MRVVRTFHEPSDAMQKVVGSNPIIRFSLKASRRRGFSCARELLARLDRTRSVSLWSAFGGVRAFRQDRA